eukprot:4559463-Prymnesium_polylepis.2
MADRVTAAARSALAMARAAIRPVHAAAAARAVRRPARLVHRHTAALDATASGRRAACRAAQERAAAFESATDDLRRARLCGLYARAVSSGPRDHARDQRARCAAAAEQAA